jgi:excisionase family DNA binding protein
LAGERGLTPREVAAYLRISADRVRAMILRGEISAINTAPNRCGKPRYVVLAEHLRAFVAARQVKPPPPKTPPRRRRRAGRVDHFPEY